MFNKKVDSRPLWAWILVAMSAPAAQLASGGPWLGVLALAVVCGGVCWGIHAVAQEQPAYPRWYCAAEFLFLVLICGKFASMAASCWPTGSSYPTIPLTLLILAAFSALDGGERASRVGGVLFWFLALLYALVLGAAVKDLKVQWLTPSLEAPRAFLVPVFLLPAVACFLPRQKGRASTAALVIACVFGTVVALWTAGTLSPMAAKALHDPFYEFSKSLSLFGVAERFEAFVSVALTLGYFGLLSYLLSAAGHLAEAIHPGWGRMGVLCCAAGGAVIMLFCPRVAEIWLAAASVVFWGILPLLTQSASKIKKSKKPEKRA